MINKPFCSNLYKENDMKAKLAIRRYLDKLGYHSLIKPEDYKADLTSYNEGICVRHEVEIKGVWRGSWPKEWDTVQIPQRKSKLLNGNKIVFWVIRADCKAAWCIHDTFLVPDILKEVPNIYTKKGEYFFCIPIEQCRLITIPD
jgi:hypothetical protein